MLQILGAIFTNFWVLVDFSVNKISCLGITRCHGNPGSVLAEIYTSTCSSHRHTGRIMTVMGSSNWCWSQASPMLPCHKAAPLPQKAAMESEIPVANKSGEFWAYKNGITFWDFRDIMTDKKLIRPILLLSHWSRLFCETKFSIWGAMTAGQWCSWGTRWLPDCTDDVVLETSLSSCSTALIIGHSNY